MTRPPPKPCLARIHALNRKKSDLKEQQRLVTIKCDTIARDGSAAERQVAAITAQVSDASISGVLSGTPYEPATATTRALRAAKLKAESNNKALPYAKAELAEVNKDTAETEKRLKSEILGYTSEVQGDVVSQIWRPYLLGIIPVAAQILAIDIIRARHASGALASIPAGGDRLWQGQFVISKFLNSIPKQLLPEGLTIEVIQRESHKYVTEMDAELFKGE